MKYIPIIPLSTTSGSSVHMDLLPPGDEEAWIRSIAEGRDVIFLRLRVGGGSGRFSSGTEVIFDVVVFDDDENVSRLLLIE